MSLAPRVDLIENRVAAIQVADANKTLTSSDVRHQVFTGFSTSRDVTLPTTGIVAGETWRIENTAAFDMVVKSSNGSALTIANGANIDATIRVGYVLLRATQAAPTTPAHWSVIDLKERYVFSSLVSNINASPPTWAWNIDRSNKQVTMLQTTAAISSTPKNNTSDPFTNTALSLRFIPNLITTGYLYSDDNAANYFLGILYLSGGQFVWHKSNYVSTWATTGCAIYSHAVAFNTP